MELPRAGIINSGEIMKQTAPAVNKTSMTYNISVLYARIMHTQHICIHMVFSYDDHIILESVDILL